MANSDSPNGLWPVAARDGTTPIVREYTVSQTYGSAIGANALVSLGPLGPIRFAAASTAVIGVSENFVASTTAAAGLASPKAKLSVYVDPDQRYHIQTDDNTATTLAAFQGNHFSVQGIGTYNTTTLQSKEEAKTGGGVADKVLVCEDVYSRVDQVINTSYTRIVVFINPMSHLQRGGSAWMI